MESVKFSDCNKEYLEDQFGLIRLTDYPAIDAWIEKSTHCELDEIETGFINRLQKIAIQNFDAWIEIELLEYFIGPLLSLVNFNTSKFKIFSERKISGVVENVELYGEPDAIIATGKYTPKLPYFCMNEYKKQEENRGDAAGQCLAPMLVAQELNGHTLPLYGIYVVGKYWNFMVLKEKEYCISKSFVADDEEIFDIFRMLKALKEILLGYE
jgi:hypothetical protein